MKTVSNEFKTAAIAPVKQTGATVVVYGEGTTASYNETNYLQSVSFESSGELFGTIATSVNIKLLGSEYDLVGKTISIRYELVVENGTESIEFGSFKVVSQEISKNKESTTVTAYSKMLELQNTEYSEIKGFPMTVEEMAQEIAERANLTLEDMSDLPNYDYEIQEELYSHITGENYRNIIAEIAGTTGTIAKINNGENTLVFSPHQSIVQQELDYTYLKKYTIGEHYGPVNSLILSRLPQEDNIAVSDQESIEENGLTECKIANNEIMDDEREVFIQPLFEAINGIEWTGFEIETVGLGWLECGDRISITDDENGTIEGIVTYVKLTIDGGVKELIKGVIPDKTATNYALSGGITKTIYNTEIKVDKQNQNIQSIVSEQLTFENQTAENFTNITQNITSVITSVQNSGGNNLIKNSAMYALDSETRLPLYWGITGDGTLTILPSSDASASGSLSGQIIGLHGTKATQIITVKPDDDSIPEDSKTYYSFSCRIKKTAVGSCLIKLSDGTQEGVWTIEITNGSSSNYGEYAIEAMLPHSTELKLEVEGSNDSAFFVTDMMLSVGNYRSQWTQANGEFSNSQVQIDSSGITVKNSNLIGSYTRQTPQSIEIFKNNSLAGIINDEKVESKTGSFSKEIDMPPLKIVSQSDGWAFVKKEN